MTASPNSSALIYAINTLGAILGSLLAGFVLVPMIGLHLTIRVVAAIARHHGDRDSGRCRPRSARPHGRVRACRPWC